MKFFVDTANIDEIIELSEMGLVDGVTTNPSLIYKAAQLPQYKHLVDDAITYGKKHGGNSDSAKQLELTMDRLAVNFGSEILKIVPGYVSTEVDV